MCILIRHSARMWAWMSVPQNLPLALALPCDPAKELAEQLAELAWWLSLRLNAWVLSVSTRKQEAFWFRGETFNIMFHHYGLKTIDKLCELIWTISTLSLTCPPSANYPNVPGLYLGHLFWKDFCFLKSQVCTQMEHYSCTVMFNLW